MEKSASGTISGFVLTRGSLTQEIVSLALFSPLYVIAVKYFVCRPISELVAEPYEQELRLSVLGYIRPEANFTTIENLIARIRRDGDVARAMLDTDRFAVKPHEAFLRAEQAERVERTAGAGG